MEQEVKNSVVANSEATQNSASQQPNVSNSNELNDTNKNPTSTITETKVTSDEVDFDEFEEEEEETKGASKVNENSTGANVDETNSNTQPTTSIKKSQTKEENKKYAEMRRAERGKKRAELEKKSYNKGVIEATNGINPYTQEKIVNDEDIEEFKNMQEMVKKGMDPILDYPKFIKQKKIEEKEAKAKEEQARIQQEQVMKQAEERYTSDISDFKSKNPEVDIDKELWNNAKFMKFADGKIGRYALDTIYKDYVAFTSEYENTAKEKAKLLVAINQTSSGSLVGAERATKPTDYRNMSKEEFEKQLNKVLKG